MVSCNLIAGQEYNLKVFGYNKNTTGAFTITVSYGKMIQTDTPIYENLSTSDDQWYVFTAPVTGFYRFYNIDSNANTRGELYEGNMLLASDDSQYGNDFSFGYFLQSGQEYLFKVVFPSTSAPAQKKYTLVLTEYVSLDGTGHAYDNVEPDLEYWYCLTPDTTSEYSFIAYSSVEITASLYEGTTQVAGPVSGLSGSQEGFSINATLTAGKTYHLKITGGNLAGRFTLYASGAADRNPLTLYETQERYLDTASVHWYKFTPAETRNYRFFTDGSAKTKVELYQGSNLVGTYYDYSNATSPWNKINIERELTAGLEYRLRVSCYGGESGSYQLTVHDYEEISEGQTVSGSIASDGQNWYRFTPTMATEHVFYTEGTMATFGVMYEGCLSYYILSESNPYIETSKDKNGVTISDKNFYEKVEVDNLKTYYIKIVGYDGSTGNYTFTILNQIFPKGDFYVKNKGQNQYLTANPSGSNVTVGNFLSSFGEGNSETQADRQIWHFGPIAETEYVVSSYAFLPKRVLTSSGATALTSETADSLRVLKNAEDGSYRILAGESGNLALTVGADGQTVSFSAYTGTANQKWEFERKTVTLAGMHDHIRDDGFRRDFSDWINTTSSNNAKALGAYNFHASRDKTPFELIEDIANSYFFVIWTHGSPHGIECYSTRNYNYDPTYLESGSVGLNVNMINDLPDDYFAGTKCVILLSCLTAGDNGEKNNFATALHNKGVGTVIAFEEEIFFYRTESGVRLDRGTPLWANVVLKSLSEEDSFSEAIQLGFEYLKHQFCECQKCNFIHDGTCECNGINCETIDEKKCNCTCNSENYEKNGLDTYVVIGNGSSSICRE